MTASFSASDPYARGAEDLLNTNSVALLDGRYIMIELGELAKPENVKDA